MEIPNNYSDFEKERVRFLEFFKDMAIKHRKLSIVQFTIENVLEDIEHCHASTTEDLKKEVLAKFHQRWGEGRMSGIVDDIPELSGVDSGND